MLRSACACSLTFLGLAASAVGADPVPAPQPVRLAEPSPALNANRPLVPPPLPLPKASSLTSSEHLRQAIDHLKQAGLDVEATDLQRKFDDLQEHRHSELHDKRKQLQQLQCEIAELEHQIGATTQYELNCLIGEISTSRLKKFGITFEAKGTEKSVSRDGLFESWTNHLIPAAEFDELAVALKTEGVLTSLAHPTVVTAPGRLTRMQISGVPEIVQVAGTTEEPTTSISGLEITTVLTPHGKDQIFLQFESNAGTGLEPKNVPQIFSDPQAGNLALAEQAKTTFGRIEQGIPLGTTLTVTGPGFTRDGEQWVRFIAVTASNATLPAVVREAKLIPIPESTTIIR